MFHTPRRPQLQFYDVIFSLVIIRLSRSLVLGQDWWSETKKSVLVSHVVVCGLGLAGLVLCCETRSCHARRHSDLEGHSNFSSTIYSFSILCLEHHYCGDQQWRSLS